MFREKNPMSQHHHDLISQKSIIPIKFSLSELAGSLGDFGTIIPLILAVALVSDVNIRYVLLFLWDLVYSHGILLPSADPA